MVLLRRQKTAFTMMELLMVVIILTIIAVFAIPRFDQRIDLTRERTAIVNLRVLQASEYRYRAETGTFYPNLGTGCAVPTDCLKFTTDLNATLGLKIIENGVQYACEGDSTPLKIFCYAYRPSQAAPVWTLSTEKQKAPACAQGTCPSCINTGCPSS